MDNRTVKMTLAEEVPVGHEVRFNHNRRARTYELGERIPSSCSILRAIQSHLGQKLSYGAIGTVIVLLFWAFLIALMVLVGGEINAVVHKAVVARRATRDDLIESQNDE